MFPSLTALEFHEQYKHNKKDKIKNKVKKKYNCEICPYSTMKEQFSIYHYNSHHDIRPFSCEICKQKFTQNSNLTIHKKTIHTLDKEYRCQYCIPTSFSRKCYLSRHIRESSW